MTDGGPVPPDIEPGAHLRPWLGYMDTFAFIVLVNYWIRVAWRTAPEATMSYPPAAPVGSSVSVARQAS